MAFGVGDYLAGLKLDSAAAARLQAMAGGDSSGGPAPAPAPSAVQQEGVAPTGAPAQTVATPAPPAGPGIVDRAAKWLGGLQGGNIAPGTPTQKEVAGTVDPTYGGFGKKEPKGGAEADSTPKGPAGDDGFPSYRNLNDGSGASSGSSSPGYVVPGHWQNGTRSASEQHANYDPALVEGSQYNRDLAAGHRLEEGDLHLQAAKQQGEADAAYAAANIEAQKQYAEQQQALASRKQDYMNREQETLADLSQKAAGKVDPDAAKGSSGAQLFAALGVAMGAFGASINGGQNTALAIVNANIDRNIRAQEANIANAKGTLKDQQSLYKQNLDAFGDRERAVLATKVQMLDQAKAMADQQYAKAKGTINEADYKGLLAKIADERAKASEDWAEKTKVVAQNQLNEHYVPPTVVGGPGGGGAKGKEKLYVPTLGGYARDEETARKLNNQGAQRMQINEDLRTIDSLLKESKRLNSVGDYGRMEEIRKEIAARSNTVLQRSTVLRGQGAMSEGDKVVAEQANQLANIDPRGKTDAQIDRARKGLHSAAQSQLTDHRLEGEANGIQLGTETYQTGPNGPEARANLQGKNKVLTKKTEGVEDIVEKPKGVSDR